MNLTCIICSDRLGASSETYTTHCGHVFHYHCLMQWIERSKTCPQCRNKTTERNIHRIYFNVANTDSIGDDIATLQNKYDNLQFQLMLKEKDVKNFTDKYSKIKQQNCTLREEIAELESKTRAHDSLVHALKDQISFYKCKAKERDKYVEEITKLKSKIKQMESIDLAVNGSREEVTEMLKNENNIDSLVILVATLKKALLDAEKKKTNMEHKFKQIQNEVTKQRKEVNVLELSNRDLKKALELAKEGNYLMKKIPKTINLDPSQNVSDSEKRSSESPVALRVNIMVSPKESPVEKKVDDILQSTSPYLSVQKSIAGLSAPINFKKMHSSVGMSIFKRPKISADSMKTSKSENMIYNGLGGQSKEDIFPTVKSHSCGIKRRIEPTTAGTKLRKTDSLVIFKR